MTQRQCDLIIFSTFGHLLHENLPSNMFTKVGWKYRELLYRSSNLATCWLFKWANPGLFLFIFVRLNVNFYRNIVNWSGIRTKIVGVEGEHADHLTTINAHLVTDLASPICILNLSVMLVKLVKLFSFETIPRISFFKEEVFFRRTCWSKVEPTET